MNLEHSISITITINLTYLLYTLVDESLRTQVEELELKIDQDKRELILCAEENL